MPSKAPHQAEAINSRSTNTFKPSRVQSKSIRITRIHRSLSTMTATMKTSTRMKRMTSKSTMSTRCRTCAPKKARTTTSSTATTQTTCLLATSFTRLYRHRAAYPPISSGFTKNSKATSTSYSSRTMKSYRINGRKISAKPSLSA